MATAAAAAPTPLLFVNKHVIKVVACGGRGYVRPACQSGRPARSYYMIFHSCMILNLNL